MKIPDSCLKTPKSKAGAIRQYSIMFNAYTRAFSGGGSFGWDWTTLRANAGEDYYNRMQTLKGIIWLNGEQS
jgi:hypothetical protein